MVRACSAASAAAPSTCCCRRAASPAASRSTRPTACAPTAGAACASWPRPGAAAAASPCRTLRSDAPLCAGCAAEPPAFDRGARRTALRRQQQPADSRLQARRPAGRRRPVRPLDGPGRRGAAGRHRPDRAGAAASLAPAAPRLQPVGRAGAAHRRARPAALGAGRPAAPSRDGVAAGSRALPPASRTSRRGRSASPGPNGLPARGCCSSTTCRPRAPRSPPAPSVLRRAGAERVDVLTLARVVRDEALPI